MQLTDLRRWHWIVIGALLGLIFGYSLNAIGTDAMETGATSSKTSQTTFESEIVADPITGNDGNPEPFITNLVVYPDGPINLLRMQRFVNLEPDKRMDSKKWEYQTWFYEARRPYSPLIGAPRTDVRIKPDFPAEGYQGDNNWRTADGGGKMYRDPGADGVRLFLGIAKGDYDLVVKLDDPKEATGLIAKFNDHPLAPFTVDQTDSQWVHTSIPMFDFGADNARVLSLARKDSPVHIRQIHIYDPTYTVRDYLNGLQAERGANGLPAHPNIHYRYAWWMEPKTILWLSVGGCVLGIGIIWPTLLNVLVGAGLGPPPREKGVSLRNLKATPVAVPMAKVPTEADLNSLEELEESLLKSLETDGEEQVAGTATAAGPAPIRVLNAKPAAEPVASPPQQKEDTPKTFKGEYYPVARKAGSDDPPKKPE
jgi:hypothetical protein